MSLTAYRADGDTLTALDAGDDPARAVWIDLLDPGPSEVKAVAAMGITVPGLAALKEIEISNRFHSERGAFHMTIMLPGLDGDGRQINAPVSFILTASHLVTVRFHRPRPFETFGRRDEDLTLGCDHPAAVFLELAGEIVGRLADLTEAVGDALDRRTHVIYGEGRAPDASTLRESLAEIGREGENLNRVRLGLVTLERALGHFAQMRMDAPDSLALQAMTDTHLRDIVALNEHADFLSDRLSFANDTTLGMINLRQNDTVRILSVVSTLLMPPTLIASLYGMNFTNMPELDTAWGYPVTLLLMVVASAGTYFYFVWRGWL